MPMPFNHSITPFSRAFSSCQIYKKFTPLLFGGLLGAFSANANMKVYPMQVSLNNQGAAHVSVASRSEEIQYVKSEVKKVLNPGMPDEKTVSADHWQDDGLVVTPMKFGLAAGAQRTIRLVALDLPAKESTWRVYFEGVPSLNDDPTQPSDSNKFTSQVGVSIVWGVLVHVPPKNPVVALHVDKKGQIVNTGTQRIPLEAIGICKAKDQCRWVDETATIYPDGYRLMKVIQENPGAAYKVRYQNWLKAKTEEIDLPLR